MICPCGLPEPYEQCCGRFHRGEAVAPTAERLMRSRYSAFVVGDGAYLLTTWHPVTRPDDLQTDPGVRWLGLEVVEAEGGLLDSRGRVHFRASYLGGVVEERSVFVRELGRWWYVGPVGEHD